MAAIRLAAQRLAMYKDDALEAQGLVAKKRTPKKKQDLICLLKNVSWLSSRASTVASPCMSRARMKRQRIEQPQLDLVKLWP